MPCSRCGSHDLWDDNLYWGCNRCGANLSREVNHVHSQDRVNGILLSDINNRPRSYDTDEDDS